MRQQMHYKRRPFLTCGIRIFIKILRELKLYEIVFASHFVFFVVETGPLTC